MYSITINYELETVSYVSFLKRRGGERPEVNHFTNFRLTTISPLFHYFIISHTPSCPPPHQHADNHTRSHPNAEIRKIKKSKNQKSTAEEEWGKRSRGAGTCLTLRQTFRALQTSDDDTTLLKFTRKFLWGISHGACNLGGLGVLPVVGEFTAPGARYNAVH